MTDSYPRLAARTSRFTLGIPRCITVAPDGSKVWFLRTPDGVTNVGMLFEFDSATGIERLVADPRRLLEDDETLPTEERVRRERSRETGAGIVDFTVDESGHWASFALSGKAWVVDLGDGAATALQTPDGVIDPRVDPAGNQVAYVAGRALRVVSVAGADDRVLASPMSETQTWGLAEFIAAEELDRHRGHWWAPDGQSLLAERFDVAQVNIWQVADPATPGSPPTNHRYPVAGSANADVTLWHFRLDGHPTEIQWDRAAFEYLASVTWTEGGPPVIQVLSRDQTHLQIRSVDTESGVTTLLRELHDPAWVDLTSPPRFAAGGRLISIEDQGGRRRVVVDGTPVSDPAWQVRHLISAADDHAIVTASTEPTEIQIVRIGFDGTVEPLTFGPAVHAASVGGRTRVISRSSLDSSETSVAVVTDRGEHSITVLSEPPPFSPTVNLLRAGAADIRTAVVFPEDHEPGSGRLPILMNSYAGPHAQRALASARMFLEPQWFANKGFCVVVADGRGTPGRDPDWERAVHNDLATPVLDDQLAALQTVIETYPEDVDPKRVGIVGWSFGGYLAALAVLRRPDVFHAAVAGAPVTDWRLYDTAYTERYLGHPESNASAYDACSLLAIASQLTRPLLLIHGLADDNVFAAHTLQLSSALLAAGRQHAVLPLSGITHMASHESVAEGLAIVQMDFLTHWLHRRT